MKSPKPLDCNEAVINCDRQCATCSINDYKNRCRHCFALAEGNNGEWICDEVDKPIEQVKDCGEWGDEVESDIEL